MKILYKIIIISLFFFPKVYAGSASEYKITMTLLELCDSTSSLTSCNNPVVIGSGSSGAIDIAGTTAGASAASYGSLATVPIGTTYSHMQVTMNRLFTATGSAIDGAGDECFTNNGNDGADNTNASGHASTATSITLAMGYIGAANGDATNSATAGDGSGTSRVPGQVTTGDDFLEYRLKLTTDLTLKAGEFPTVKVAFGTSNAIGAAGNMKPGGGAACATGSATVGLFGAEPDVTVSFE